MSAAAPAAAPTAWWRRLGSTADALLTAAALGVMYALVAYAALGAWVLPLALFAAGVALLMGGASAAWPGEARLLVSGPTASGALVVAGMLRELQTLPEAQGRVAPALFAVAFVVLGTGVLQLLFARWRLGNLLKFLPYPVLSGFANSVALLLVLNMVPAALGKAEAGRLSEAWQWLEGWKPLSLGVALAGTLAGLALARWLPRAPAVVLALLLASALHYGLAAAGFAAQLGPMLPVGAATSGALHWPDGQAWAQAFLQAPAAGLAYWGLLLRTLLVLAVLASLFSLLTAARLASPLDPPVDGNRLLRRQGLGNLGAGLANGLPVAVLGPATLPLRAAGAPLALPLALYLAGVVLLFGFGQRLLAGLPMAAVAAAVFVSARSLFDLSVLSLLRQLWGAGSGSARGEAAGPLAVTALVVAVALLQGLAAALFVGGLAAACLLALELRRGVVLAEGDGRTRHSRRLRDAEATQALRADGARIRVVELGHWLYFGTADELGTALDRAGQATGRGGWVVVDLKRVSGVDATAARSLLHAAQRLGVQDVRLVLSGIDEARRGVFDLFRAADGSLPLRFAADLDAALEEAEDALLADQPRREAMASGLPLAGLEAAQSARLAAECRVLELPAGSVLFRAGDAGDALYAVQRGCMTLRLEQAGRAPIRLLSFGPGVLFGEMALLDGRARSAVAVASEPTQLLVLPRERFAALAESDPGLHAAVLRGLALHLVGRLRDTTAQLSDAG